MNAPASAVFYSSYPLATTLRSPLARWFLTRHHGPPDLMSELAKQLVS